MLKMMYTLVLDYYHKLPHFETVAVGDFGGTQSTNLASREVLGSGTTRRAVGAVDNARCLGTTICRLPGRGEEELTGTPQPTSPPIRALVVAKGRRTILMGSDSR